MQIIKALGITILLIIVLGVLFYFACKRYVKWYLSRKEIASEKKIGINRYLVGTDDHKAIVRTTGNTRHAKRLYIKRRRKGDFGQDKKFFNLKNTPLSCKIQN